VAVINPKVSVTGMFIVDKSVASKTYERVGKM
jgi:hypothetical protein